MSHSATGIASDEFTPWAQTGHAEIFTDSLNTSDHCSTSCLAFHTVGYDPDVDNGGFGDADDYEDFLAAFTSEGSHFHADPDNWDIAPRPHTGYGAARQHPVRELPGATG